MIDIHISHTLQFAGGSNKLKADVSLPSEEITAIYGNSGAGKTTLLKMIAGLLKPEWGSIVVNGATWFHSEKKINLPPQRRSIGFVFQDYALFPNMTVLENLRFAAGKQRDENWLSYLVELVSLQSFLHTKPNKLSGGQQQRVALIRALVRKPGLLLLDEPFSSLQTELKQNLREALQILQKELRFTALLVSHDAGDVYTLCKHVIELEQGKIMFRGSPSQLFHDAGLSSKLQITADVLSITPNGVVFIVELLVASGIIKVIATEDDVAGMKTGDQVLLYTKAFHLGIRKRK